MNYLKKSKLFYVVVLSISLFILWGLIREIDLFRDLFQVTVGTLLVPSIVSLFIYYLLKPLYIFLLKKLKKESLSLLITFVVFFIVVGLLFSRFIPMLVIQVEGLVNNVPELVEELDSWLISTDLFNGQELDNYLSMINRSFEDLIEMVFVGLRSSTNFVFGFISNSFLIITIVPFMVLYMLKETNKPKSWKVIPENYRGLFKEYFDESENVLSNYISGKALVCFYVFIGSLITFWFAGLPGAFLFAVVAGIMDIVPYFGPWIGAFPAVLSALITSDANVWIIVIGIVLVQLGESYLVSPLVMSKEIKIHPFVVIILMLITGQVFGLVGMIIILPVVALIQVSVKYAIRFYKLHQSLKKA